MEHIIDTAKQLGIKLTNAKIDTEICERWADRVLLAKRFMKREEFELCADAIYVDARNSSASNSLKTFGKRTAANGRTREAPSVSERQWWIVENPMRWTAKQHRQAAKLLKQQAKQALDEAQKQDLLRQAETFLMLADQADKEEQAQLKEERLQAAAARRAEFARIFQAIFEGRPFRWLLWFAGLVIADLIAAHKIADFRF